ncbi:MAG: TDP-N-acetylfucosamine:lipid II N-acetylfucosaminyltransferase [Desulfomicrobium sp.]|nr:TDP-N-acetylfucosamine:lipid II N-acetylfucosaminyltransferase [Desulfomicrobium sp.]
MSKIIHIGDNNEFIPPFIEFIKDNFDFQKHHFHLRSGMAEVVNYTNVSVYEHTVLKGLKYYILALIKMHRADKIILHGLFDIKLVFFLALTPWLLKKCYWVMWGGDLYQYKFGKKNKYWWCGEFFRRRVIKNIANLVTYIKGDVELARRWYQAQGVHVECLMYPSNIFKDYQLEKKVSEVTTILVGNSADPSNNHSEILHKLIEFKDRNIKVITPLSYGNQAYAKQVITEGKKLLGNRYQALTKFVPFEKYLEILAQVDVAVFNHKRQQAMGNTITLLGLGKKVYIRSEVSQWKLFKNLGIVVHDVEKLNKTLFSDTKKNNKNNNTKVKEYFSKENYLSQLKVFL